MSVPTHDGRGRALLSADELARRLGKEDRRAVYRLVEKGLPAYRLGRSLVFDEDAVFAWLDRHRVGEWPNEEAA